MSDDETTPAPPPPSRWLIHGGLCALVAFTVAFEIVEVLAGHFDASFAPAQIIGAMVAMGGAHCAVTSAVVFFSKKAGLARVMLVHVLVFIAVMIASVGLYAAVLPH
jgi:hypothetical protein